MAKTKVEITYIPIGDLKPYDKNPRLNDNAVPAVAASIKEFGFKVPIVIDKNFIIVCGNTRYKAAELLELEKVPCIIADDLTPEQIKAFRLADNKVAEFAEWDFALLADELEELTAFDVDLSAFGFDDNIFAEELPPDDDLPDELELPRDGKNTSVQINNIQYNGSKIPLSDEEKVLLDAKIEQYLDEHKVMFGFIGWLIKGGFDNADTLHKRV